MAIDSFLKVGTLKGESVVKGFEDQMQILSWGWGMTQTGTTHSAQGGGAGKVDVQDLQVTKYIDAASPNIMLFCANGKHFTKGKVIVRKAGEKPLEYLTIEIEKVLVSSYMTGGGTGEERLIETVTAGNIAVVAGYQGVDAKGDITTLGRGASDLTAVALAAALKADACEIYTDVEGVFTADPNICPRARKLGRISYDEMMEMAGLGAKVLQLRSVELARRYNVALVVRSSFSEAEGTWVGQEDKSMEDVMVSGVTLDQNQSKITITQVADRPGLAARIFGPIAETGIVVDMIIQNASADGHTDVTFTVGRDDLRGALELCRLMASEIGAAGVRHEDQVAKVSIVGLGMRTHAGVAARMFRVLADEGVNIEMIATSEIKISVVVNAKYGELAMRALHDAFLGQGSHAASAESV